MDSKVVGDVSNPPLEVLLTRMEGKIDLLAQSHAHRDEHMRDLRDQVGKFTDTLNTVQNMNLPERFTIIDSRLKSHSDRLDIHDADLSQRKGAVAAVRVVWALAGAAFATVAAIIGMLVKSTGV